MTKTCNKCGETKDFSFFYKNKYGKYGLNGKCKQCSSLDRKEHYKKNKNAYYKAKYRWQEKTNPGVYLITANNGTYVGQSKAIEGRVYGHNCKVNHRSPVDRILRWEILEVVEDETKRKEREKYWIDKLKPSLNVLLPT